MKFPKNGQNSKESRKFQKNRENAGNSKNSGKYQQIQKMAKNHENAKKIVKEAKNPENTKILENGKKSRNCQKIRNKQKMRKKIIHKSRKWQKIPKMPKFSKNPENAERCQKNIFQKLTGGTDDHSVSIPECYSLSVIRVRHRNFVSVPILNSRISNVRSIIETVELVKLPVDLDRQMFDRRTQIVQISIVFANQIWQWTALHHNRVRN